MSGLPEGRGERGEIYRGKGGQVYDDGQKFNFEW